MTVRREGRLRNLGTRLENGLKAGLIESGQLVSQRATRKAPRDTGRLKRSIHEGRPYRSTRTRWVIDVGTNVEYAATQEFGSGIHAEGGGKPITITAKNKQALSFNWPNAPAGVQAMFPTTFPRVFFKSVQNRGVRPQPYLRPALRQSSKEIRAIMLRAVVGAMRKR